jgi:hypothetical protein
MTRIKLTDGSGGPDACSHQEKLAISLIQSLGIEGAIHACQANSWDGVLKCVLLLRGHAGPAGA